MSLLYKCPLPSEIAQIGNAECPQSIDQVVRILFQRMRNEAGENNLMPLGNVGGQPVVNKSELETLLTATDNTKVQFTPLVENLTIPLSEPILEGGGSNETTFGLPQVTGDNPVAIDTARFRNLDSMIRKQLKEYESEGANFGQLGIYYVNEHNRLIGDGLYLKNDSVTLSTGVDQIIVTLSLTNASQYTVGESVSIESTPTGDLNGTFVIESVDTVANTITLTAPSISGSDTEGTIVAGGLRPISISSLYFSSPSSEGYGTATFTTMRYSKTSKWADDLRILDVNPNDFAVLYDVQNP